MKRFKDRRDIIVLVSQCDYSCIMILHTPEKGCDLSFGPPKTAFEQTRRKISKAWMTCAVASSDRS